MYNKLALIATLLVMLTACQDASETSSDSKQNTPPTRSETTQPENPSDPAQSQKEKTTLSGTNSETTDKAAPSAAAKSEGASQYSAANREATSEPSQQQKIQALFAEANHTLFQHRAVSATLYGISQKDVGYYYGNQLEDYSVQSEALLRAEMRRLQQALVTLRANDTRTDENRQVVADIVDYFAGMPHQPNGFIDVWMGHSPFIVNQINGPMIDIPNNLLNSHKITNEAEALDYLARLKAFRSMTDGIVEKLNADAARNWLPPRVLAKKAINYLEKFTQPAPRQAPLYQNFARRVAALSDLSAARKEALLQQAEAAIQNSVYRGFEQVLEAMQAILPRTRLESGIWAQPGGDAFYAYSIRKLGDTELDAEAIHQLGLAEVERISKQMDKILVAQGYQEGTPGERMAKLGEDPRFLYPNNDEGRAQLLADLNRYVKAIDAKMDQQFATRPAYPVEIKRIPVATEDSSAGGYYTSPAMDGSVPGIYWINLKDTHTNPTFSLKTLTFHEAIPGHHWQIALNLGQTDLPLLRRIAPYNAYVEGWALYSEQVAAEMGMYQDDPFGDLGRLQAELYRAVRLVVDTGLHYKKWTREQAIEYMATTTGSPEADVISEIERYMAWPGQALGYKLGMIRLLELREKAKQALKDQFDIKAFHDLILLGGAVPGALLEEKVESWIVEQQARQSKNTTNNKTKG